MNLSIESACSLLNIGTVRQEQYDVCLAYSHYRKDVIFIAPTGFGKSLVYQVAPLISKNYNNQKYIVIMPLVSLIEDAVSKLNKMLPEHPAVHLCQATLTSARKATFILTSPETLIEGCGRDLLQDAGFASQVETVFVDEFHTVESWGTGIDGTPIFRESCGRLGEVRAFTQAPIVCMSATATAETTATVSASLGLVEPAIITVNTNKANITYHVVKTKKRGVIANMEWLVQLASNSQEMPHMLIFFNNRSLLQSAYEYVTKEVGQPKGHTHPIYVMYHKLTGENRKAHIIADMNSGGSVRVVFCTKSFSMGINLPCIKYVIHYGVPATADQFLQETGRAARERSMLGESIIICHPFMSSGRKVDDTMKLYTSHKTCLRELVLSHFSAIKPADQQLCCDVCGGLEMSQVKILMLANFEHEDSESEQSACECDDVVARSGDISSDEFAT